LTLLGGGAGVIRFAHAPAALAGRIFTKRGNGGTEIPDPEAVLEDTRRSCLRHSLQDAFVLQNLLRFYKKLRECDRTRPVRADIMVIGSAVRMPMPLPTFTVSAKDARSIERQCVAHNCF
jgi:hypothetical protein